jgi:UDP-2-acetamido-2-deoxy-ribo-hexuluronate aminotransferase
MTIPFIDLDHQQARIRRSLQARLDKVLSHGLYILGPEVSELEAQLAAMVGLPHCITCANGTDAIQIALMALEIGPGDEVITPSFSYIAAAEAIRLLGATPVFVDVDPASFLVTADEIARHITTHTKAIVPVSLFGQCPDMTAINALAERHGLTVIEDAAQSLGATQGGVSSGALSRVATTSFFPSKPLGCYGDGGAMFTSDDALAEELRKIARHGQVRRYHHERIGINSRLDTIQAAVLLTKLEVFAEEIALRDDAAQRLGAALAGLPITLPKVMAGNTSVWAQYTIRCDNRDAVAAGLKDRGVPTAIHYPIPLHRQKAFDSDISLPVSEALSNTVLSLPMHPYLSDHVIETVAAGLGTVLQQTV